MAVDVDRETQDLRRHVRAVGLINGALYRPRRWHSWVHRGRHRPHTSTRLSQTMTTIAAAFTRHRRSRGWFITTAVLGSVLSAAGLGLLAATTRRQPGLFTVLAGLILLGTAVLILTTILLTASPDERPVVDPHDAQRGMEQHGSSLDS